MSTEGNRDPWGILHKIARNKIRHKCNVGTIVTPSGEKTKSWRESISVLLQRFAPQDDVDKEMPIHKNIRDSNKQYINHNLESNIKFSEVQAVIKRLKNKKAPGSDGLSTEIVRAVWENNSDVFLDLCNKCLRERCFPDDWKTANLIIIPKNVDADRELVSTYRPIALLPVMSKIYERIIVDRIQTQYVNMNLESNRQFGFKKGLSTEDALLAFKDGVSSSISKYVVALFVDVEGAFDNLWWPAITARLVQAQCSSTLVRIIEDYFTKCKVVVSNKFERVEHQIQRGCPQGSIIGPLAWNWCMDSLLSGIGHRFAEDEVRVIAYADDIAFIIMGNTRNEIEMRAAVLTEELQTWCTIHKLKVSAKKTQAMLMKGKLSKERMPRIKINNAKIKYTEHTSTWAYTLITG